MTYKTFRITFETHSEILGKSSRSWRDFKSMADFRLHTLALYSGAVRVVSIEDLCSR